MTGISDLSSSWAAAGRAILISIATLVVLLTLAGAIPSNEWWLRVWDFPRLIVFAAEFEFRYNNREANGCNDGERAVEALRGIVGKRLAYRSAGCTAN